MAAADLECTSRPGDWIESDSQTPNLPMTGVGGGGTGGRWPKGSNLGGGGVLTSH